MNVLINAYAVSPAWGSEPGMGWNWISNIAKYCNLFVITEGEWQQEIEEAKENHPYKDHLHFYYLPVSEKVRIMCWNQGDWRFYWHYRKWQKRALSKAQEICIEKNIDVVHQLNMVGFREPGYLWKINKPLVWGPIGGLEEIPVSFIKDAPFMIKAFTLLKNNISNLQIRYSPRINKAFLCAAELISAVPAAKKQIKKYKHRDSLLIPETGCYDLKTEIIDKRQRNDFHIMWVAKFDYRKRLDIALRTIEKIKDLPNLHFHIIGTGNEKQINYYKSMACQLGIDSLCLWYGKVDNSVVHKMMQEVDLFFFTSINEATSTVIPEAINNCLPIVCFNACGFGPLVTENIGCKVELTTPEQAIKEFSDKIRSLYNNRQLLHEMSYNCREVLKSLLWEEKAKRVVELYRGLLA